MNSIDTLIPEKEDLIEIHPFGKSDFVITHPKLNYQVKANKLTLQLLDLVDGISDIKKITEMFDKKYNTSISTTTVYDILYKGLSKFGIIINSEVILEKRKTASYLRLSFIFIREKYVDHVSRNLTFMFKGYLPVILMTSMSIFILWTYVLNFNVFAYNAENLISFNIILYFIFFKLGSLVHEFGHATACAKFGAKNGGIGFGFYLLMPVLFTDVSDVWRLTAKQRIIVNLAGIYFELILASFCLIIFHINNNPVFLITPTLMIISTLYNLNPLLRYDGYWVLVDLIGIPNLQKDSQKEVITFFRSFFLMQVGKFSCKKIFLIVYGILSSIWIVFLLGGILYFDPQSIANFPIEIYNISHCLSNSLDLVCIQNISKLVLPVVFLVLIFRGFIWPIFKNIAKQTHFVDV